MENIEANPQVLVDIVKTKMPFGKYKDTLICDIPISYLEWMQRKGFPPGKLGMLMSTTYEIKLNGLDKLLWMIKAGKR
ncbi:DUF3820 family protein [Mucilaginibacter psychrotolerans]|uniref:DUF3820 family protein n=1 Tax=Mucilaginibacter psychrotolerans TaxID=1524096 RepID=UPI0021D32790|nr:DUF3820 family protein [Mucilaginibacter psychrotolerans]